MSDHFGNSKSTDDPRPWQVRLLPLLLITTGVSLYFGWARSWHDAPLWLKTTFGACAILCIVLAILRYDIKWRRYQSGRKRIDGQRQQMERIVRNHRERANADDRSPGVAGQDAANEDERSSIE